MTTCPTLQDRAEAVSVDVPTKASKDARTGAEYLRDLQQETAASLRQDPGRWRSVQSRGTRAEPRRTER